MFITIDVVVGGGGGGVENVTKFSYFIQYTEKNKFCQNDFTLEDFYTV